MSHSLHIILRCNVRTSNTPVTRCPGYFIGGTSRNIAEVRASAKDKGWGFRPGQPYTHINATDYCPEHKP